MPQTPTCGRILHKDVDGTYWYCPRPAIPGTAMCRTCTIEFTIPDDQEILSK